MINLFSSHGSPNASYQREAESGAVAPCPEARIFFKCAHCGQEKFPNRMCENCGYYAGRQVIDVLAKLDKKERKKKEKELHEHEEETQKGKTLSAEELSHK